MSHTRVKTTYSVEGAYGSTETKTLYCHHNHSCDYTTFYDEDGSITSMCFSEWVTGDNLWDAMERLWFPFKDKWGGELKDKVEYYYKAPWEAEEQKGSTVLPAVDYSDRYRNIKTEENYMSLLKSGMFWELHPELTGHWYFDGPVMCRFSSNEYLKAKEIITQYEKERSEMKTKLYFKEDNEYCTIIEDIIDEMKFNEQEEATVHEAVKEKLDTGFFWCRVDCSFYEKGSCGKSCAGYDPCNGKSGKCKHYSLDTYAHGKAMILNVNGELREKQTKEEQK